MKRTLNYLSTLEKNINHWNHLYAVGQVDRETCEYVIKALRAQFWGNEMARTIEKEAEESWQKTFGKGVKHYELFT